MRSRRRVPLRRARALVIAGSLLTAACTVEVVADDPTPTSPTAPTTAGTTASPTTITATTTSTSSTTTTSTTTTSTTSTSSTSTTTSTTSTSTTTTSTTSTVPVVSVPEEPPPFDASRAAFGELARSNGAAALSVWRDGRSVLEVAVGADRAGEPLTTATPMVVASVSKLFTSLTIARLVQAGEVDIDDAVPWATMGLATEPGWDDVTVRQLLTHTSGMPIARQSWLDDPGTCAEPLSLLLTLPPTPERGRWVYSNGNYCALGLLIEAVTGERYDDAARRLVLEPAGVGGEPHLTTDGPRPGDGPYDGDIARFDRLGAAGSWLAGTEHVAAVLASATAADRSVMVWPSVFLDHYGWGHTGTVRGAKACAWVLEGGRTVVAATIAGERPSTGGGVCDALLPAIGIDLGLVGVDGRPLGEPDRSPP